MGKVQKLKNNFSNLGWWRSTALPYVRNVLTWKMWDVHYRIQGVTRRSPFDEDWDTLIILDACRYDDFLAYWQGEATVERRYSPASTSGEFLGRCVNGTYPDTVYVTANPFVVNVEDAFADVYHAWQSDWDADLGTVTPEDLVSVARKAHQEWPNKRIIVHFMQPHAPFIANREDAKHGGAGTEMACKMALGEDYNHLKTIWDAIEADEISGEEAHELYRKNLEFVLPYAMQLINSVSGKCVITADHGEAFGERYRGREVYGHEGTTHIPALVEVPWVELDGERREVSAVSTLDKTDLTDSEKEEQTEKLKALGYQ